MKKIKKIFIYILVAMIVFISVSSKYKIRTSAAELVLTGYTAYELCLYIGGLLLTGCAVGYGVENSDTIAEVGKEWIDTHDPTDVNNWLVGWYDTEANQSYVYGTEALDEVKEMPWEVIQGGGNAPKNDDDNDGDKDNDDLDLERQAKKMWSTSAFDTWLLAECGQIYDKWKNGQDNCLGAISNEFVSNDGIFTGYEYNSDGKILPKIVVQYINEGQTYQYRVELRPCESTSKIYSYINSDGYISCFKNGYEISQSDYGNYKLLSSGMWEYASQPSNTIWTINSGSNVIGWKGVSGCQIFSNVPLFQTKVLAQNYVDTGNYSNAQNVSKTYRIADWVADDEAWKGTLTDLKTSLRSLQDLTQIATDLANNVATTQPDADAYGDMLNNIATQHLPSTTPIPEPTYYPATSTIPHLDPTTFPNYNSSPGTTPGVDPTQPTNPEDPESQVPISQDKVASYTLDLTHYFPFCIPWDMVRAVNLLIAEPKAPIIEYNLKYEPLNIDEKITIDMAPFNDTAKLLRTCETLAFMIGLMFVTRHIIRG